MSPASHRTKTDLRDSVISVAAILFILQKKIKKN